MGTLRPVPPSTCSTGKILCHPDLPKATHVFVCRDAPRKPLQPLFEGLFLSSVVLQNFCTVQLPGRQDTISIDRLKPAFLDVSDVPDTTFLVL